MVQLNESAFESECKNILVKFIQTRFIFLFDRIDLRRQASPRQKQPVQLLLILNPQSHEFVD